MTTAAVDPALQLIGRAALSLLFGAAAVHKLRDARAFREALEAYDLLPRVWTVPGGAVLIAAEVGVAAALWLPRVAPAAALAGAALLVLYGGAIGVNLLRGRRDLDCGCGGPAGRQPISGALVVRNGVFAAVAVMSGMPVIPRPLLWVDGVTVVAGLATVALLYVAAEGLQFHRRGPQRDAEELPR